MDNQGLTRATLLHYKSDMKTAVLPQVRVSPELRGELEAVLRDGETLSGFVEASVRSAVEYRRVHDAFLARGEQAMQAYRRSGVSRPVGSVLAGMNDQLDGRRKQLKPRGRS